MNRRDSLKLLGLASVAGVVPGCTPSEVEKAAKKVAATGTDGLQNRIPTILNQHEFETIRLLVNYIIPSDERSGSASDAFVPEFIDFMMEDLPSIKTPIQGGLVWLDNHCSTEFARTFRECDQDQQRSVLDQIAFPNDVVEELKTGAFFFSTIRDLTATGFFSSKIGVEDLKYMGNVARSEWSGCSEEALAHIDMTYES